MPAKQSAFPTVLPRRFPGGSICWDTTQVLAKGKTGLRNQIRWEIAKHADTPARHARARQTPKPKQIHVIFENCTQTVLVEQDLKQKQSRSWAESFKMRWFPWHPEDTENQNSEQTGMHCLLSYTWLGQNTRNKLNQKQDNKK